MAFMDDLKTDQRTQILVAGMVFFAIAFPVYFNYAASNVDEVQLSGPVGNYSVEGTYSYHQIASGSMYVNDGSTEDIFANSDASVDDIDGKNLVGVRATLTFTDDESQGGPGCAVAQGPQDDDVSGGMDYYGLVEPSSQVLSGESVNLEWHDSSLVGTTVSNMSEADIEMLLDGMGLGEGEHMLSISVSVNTGGGALCTSSDDGEEVAYVIELVSLEYTITAVE
tara:strand:- start:620 stop:1291 length:672 start_codon:yes stop_codon:yes gene_type:complete